MFPLWIVAAILRQADSTYKMLVTHHGMKSSEHGVFDKAGSEQAAIRARSIRHSANVCNERSEPYSTSVPNYLLRRETAVMVVAGGQKRPHNFKLAYLERHAPRNSGQFASPKYRNCCLGTPR